MGYLSNIPIVLFTELLYNLQVQILPWWMRIILVKKPVFIGTNISHPRYFLLFAINFTVKSF